MTVLVVSHIEIPVPDITEAKKFYGAAFDWKDWFTDFSETYVLVASPDDPKQPSFGIYQSPKIPKNKVIVTLETEDIEKRLKKIVKLGGKVTTDKYEIAPDVGFAANFVDPFGNTWGLHSQPE